MRRVSNLNHQVDELYSAIFQFTKVKAQVMELKEKKNSIKYDISEWECSHPSAFLATEVNGSVLIHLDACPRSYICSELSDFGKPNSEPDRRLIGSAGETVFLNIESMSVGNVNMVVILNQYNKDTLIKQQKIYLDRQKSFQILLDPGVKSTRIILDVTGTGYINLKQFCVEGVLLID